MANITTGLFMSLDGVVDADDDWQFPYFDEELFAVIASGWAGAGSVLLGRRSFEGYEQLRKTHPDSPVVAFLDANPVFVVSASLTEPPRDNVTIIDGSVERIERLRREGQPETSVLVLGSPTLVRWLLANELLDELNIMMLPILVGAGPRLFDDLNADRVALRLAGSRALKSGAVELSYRPVTR